MGSDLIGAALLLKADDEDDENDEDDKDDEDDEEDTFSRLRFEGEVSLDSLGLLFPLLFPFFPLLPLLPPLPLD